MDDEVRRLIDDMFETMDAARGVGLAANQVGVARRVAVVDADGERFAMVDPVIVEAEGRATAEEGCLSIPEIYGDVTRPERVVLEALDREGNRYRKEATGLMARAIQHEIDHLDGILFLDHLSLIQRQMLLARWRREHKDDTGYTKEVPGGVRPAGVMRIVFFGTPDFAVPSLRALLRERFAVAGVVTQPDQPQGRSRSALVPPPVKVAAQTAGIPRAPAGAPRRRRLRRQPAPAGARPRRRGRLRAHPAARGARHPAARHDQRARLAAAPATAAPRRSSTPSCTATRETGISIMQMEAGLDSGPGAAPRRHADRRRGDRRRAGERLAELGAVALVEALSLIAGGSPGEPQDHAARDLRAQDRPGDAPGSTGSGDAAGVGPAVRAFDPAPGAWTTLDGSAVKLFGAREVRPGRGEPGTVLGRRRARSSSAAAERRCRGRGGAAGGQARMPAAAWVRGAGHRRRDSGSHETAAAAARDHRRAVLGAADFGIRAAAIAAAGSGGRAARPRPRRLTPDGSARRGARGCSRWPARPRRRSS